MAIFFAETLNWIRPSIQLYGQIAGYVGIWKPFGNIFQGRNANNAKPATEKITIATARLMTLYLKEICESHFKLKQTFVSP